MRSLTLCFYLLIAGNVYSNAQSVEQLSWLVGDWVCEKDGLTTTESWSQRNDSTLVGTSFTVNKDFETVFEEALKIQTTSEGTEYIAVLPTKTAVFKLKDSSKKSVSFIDPKNDFPSLITYVKTSKGLRVSLEGKGNKQVIEFVRSK